MHASKWVLCVLALAVSAHAVPLQQVHRHAAGTTSSFAASSDVADDGWVNPYNETTFAKMLQLQRQRPAESAFFDACPPSTPKFSCPAPATKLPEATRVDRLRPSDISAIMSVGDSITAGFVMTSGSIITVRLVEDRGKVYSTGGDPGATSLANFLKVYNPSLIGDVTGTTPANTIGKELNAAVTGARVQDIPGQIDRLVTELATAKYLPVANKWKLLTVFIGANNLCEICSSTTEATADLFETKLRESLQRVRSKIPKTFVAVVTTFRISQVYDAAQTSTYCKNTLNTLGLCSCALKSAASRLQMDQGAAEFNRRAELVAKEFQDINDPEFSVSILPGISGLDFAQWGQCYLSNFDCFHPNEQADASFALSFWNNLFEPRGRKTTAFDPYNANIYCPTADDFFV